jgi:Zn-dependent protease with chaperone function
MLLPAMAATLVLAIVLAAITGPSLFNVIVVIGVASFPLLLLLGGLVTFIMAPAVLAFSRYQEREADRFALEITRGNAAVLETAHAGLILQVLAE